MISVTIAAGLILTGIVFLASLYYNLYNGFIFLRHRRREFTNFTLSNIADLPLSHLFHPVILSVVFVLQVMALGISFLGKRPPFLPYSLAIFTLGFLYPLYLLIFDCSIGYSPISIHILAILLLSLTNPGNSLIISSVTTLATCALFVVALFLARREGFLFSSYYSVVMFVFAINAQSFRYNFYRSVQVQFTSIMRDAVRFIKRNTLLRFLVDVLLPRSADIQGKKLELFPLCCVVFIEIPGFEEKTRNFDPQVALQTLNDIIIHLERCCSYFDIHKIKSVGAVFLAVSGIKADSKLHNNIRVLSEEAIDFSLSVVKSFHANFSKYSEFTIRIGMAYGPLTAGILGSLRCQYDVFSDTVNVASRMCTTSEDYKIQVSEEIGAILMNNKKYNFTSRGKRHVKGKGMMKTYFVEHASSFNTGEKIIKRRQSVSLASLGSLMEKGNKKFLNHSFSPEEPNFPALYMPSSKFTQSKRNSFKLTNRITSFHEALRPSKEVKQQIRIGSHGSSRNRSRNDNIGGNNNEGGSMVFYPSPNIGPFMADSRYSYNSSPSSDNANSSRSSPNITQFISSKARKINYQSDINPVEQMEPMTVEVERRTGTELDEMGMSSDEMEVITIGGRATRDTTKTTTNTTNNESDVMKASSVLLPSPYTNTTSSSRNRNIISDNKSKIHKVGMRRIGDHAGVHNTDLPLHEGSYEENSGRGGGSVMVNSAFSFGAQDGDSTDEEEDDHVRFSLPESVSTSGESEQSSAASPIISTDTEEIGENGGEAGDELDHDKEKVGEGMQVEQSYSKLLSMFEEKVIVELEKLRFFFGSFMNKNYEEGYRTAKTKERVLFYRRKTITLMILVALLDIGIIIAAEEIGFLRFWTTGEDLHYFQLRTNAMQLDLIIYLQVVPVVISLGFITSMFVYLAMLILNWSRVRWNHSTDALFIFTFVRVLMDFFIIYLLPLSARRTMAEALKVRMILYTGTIHLLISDYRIFLVSSCTIGMFYSVVQVVVPSCSRFFYVHILFFFLGNSAALFLYHKFETYLRLIYYVDGIKHRIDQQKKSEVEPLEAVLNTILPYSAWKAFADGTATSTKAISGMKAECTVAVLDVVGFTELASSIDPVDLANLLNALFSCYDICIGKYKVEKLRTIGDAYVIVSGLPDKVEKHCMEVIELVFELIELTGKVSERFSKSIGRKVQIRAGVCTGYCFGGVVGDTLICYEIIGEPVLLATKLSQEGYPDIMIASRRTAEGFYELASEEEKQQYIFIKLPIGTFDTNEELYKVENLLHKNNQ